MNRVNVRTVLAGSRIPQLACLLVSMFMLFSLFYLGGKPMAVGLFRPPLDKFAHFATFSLMTALLWVALFRDRPWWLAAIVSCIGAADEIHQIFLPGRSAGVEDFATDVLASVLTSLLLVWAGGRYQSSLRGLFSHFL